MGETGKSGRAYYAYLLGLFPVVSMYSTNIGEARAAELLGPFVVVTAIYGVGWVALFPVLRDSGKRGLAIGAFWVPFFCYGAMVDALRESLDFRAMLPMGQVAMALAGVAMAGVGFLVWFRRSGIAYGRATRFLNVLSACALGVASVQAGFRMVEQARYESPFTAGFDPALVEAHPVAELPDIYFVVFDAYARGDYLKSRFDFDNEPFLDGLRARGFYVAERSRSNYTHTQMSLASALNFSYLEEGVLEASEKDWDATVPKLAGMIWRNASVALLRHHGYRFVTLSTGVVGTEITTADEFIRPEGFRLTEFQKTLLEFTPLRSVYYRMERPVRLHSIYILDQLEAFEAESPVFLFAHLMDPHLAHTFDAEGNALSERPPYEQGYRDVVRYLNKRITGIIDGKLEANPNTVFVVMGDHGPWSDWRGDEMLPWEGTREDLIRDRTANLLAIRLPGEIEEGVLYPEITPVNVLRVVMNAYLGTKFERLEDVSYMRFPEGPEIRRVEEVY